MVFNSQVIVLIDLSYDKAISTDDSITIYDLCTIIYSYLAPFPQSEPCRSTYIRQVDHQR